MKVKYQREKQINQLKAGDVIEVFMGESRKNELFLITDFGDKGNIFCVNIENGTHEMFPAHMESTPLKCMVTIER